MSNNTQKCNHCKPRRGDCPGVGKCKCSYCVKSKLYVAPKKQKEEEPVFYPYAKESEFQNRGEDIKGSARHKYHAWRGLLQAEIDGNAEGLIKRDNLLKLEPINLESHLTNENADTILLLDQTLNKFPKEPTVVIDRILSDGSKGVFYEWRIGGILQRSRSKPISTDVDVKVVTAEEYNKEIRAEYYNFYNALKDKLLSLKDEQNLNTALSEIRKFSLERIEGLRKKDPARVAYNDFVPFYNTALIGSIHNSRSLSHALNNYGKLIKERYPDNLLKSQRRKHVANILKHGSICSSPRLNRAS